MDDLTQVGEARRFAFNMSDELGLDETAQGKVSIIVNELGNNLVKYTQSGNLIFRAIQNEKSSGIEILSIDSGPGLADVDSVLVDGFSTGLTPGTGLGAVQRQSSEFDIFSRPGKGTLIVSIVMSNQSENNFYKLSAISIPVKGETLCGDAWAVAQDGRHLSAIMVDGLGHGPLAHKASQEALSVFGARKNENIDQLLGLIHGRLKSTRGGAVFLVDSSDGAEISYSGIGNIRTIIHSAEKVKTLISQNGTAGLQMKLSRTLTQTWNLEGFLILHSDGITSRWDLSAFPELQYKHPAISAAMIYRDFSRNNDDVSVLVIGKA